MTAAAAQAHAAQPTDRHLSRSPTVLLSLGILKICQTSQHDDGIMVGILQLINAHQFPQAQILNEFVQFIKVLFRATIGHGGELHGRHIRQAQQPHTLEVLWRMEERG